MDLLFDCLLYLCSFLFLDDSLVYKFMLIIKFEIIFIVYVDKRYFNFFQFEDRLSDIRDMDFR